ncbi:unnamed protein product, partial [Ectocarpus fasciculatus]
WATSLGAAAGLPTDGSRATDSRLQQRRKQRGPLLPNNRVPDPVITVADAAGSRSRRQGQRRQEWKPRGWHIPDVFGLHPPAAERPWPELLHPKQRHACYSFRGTRRVRRWWRRRRRRRRLDLSCYPASGC